MSYRAKPMFHNPFTMLMKSSPPLTETTTAFPRMTVNIVGRVDITQTRFEDTTVLQDVDSSFFDPNDLHYYYAVVPVNAMGLMGTPSIVPDSILPGVDTVNGTPAFFIHTQPVGTGEWQVEVQSTQPLQGGAASKR